jgi:SAM-dependent methyltransferase
VVLCNVCGWLTPLADCTQNLRETCHCVWCRSKTRHRLIAAAILTGHGTRAMSLAAWTRENDRVRIYNTEMQGPLHAVLSRVPAYTCSEYRPQAPAGSPERHHHQDLMALTHADRSFDLVVSSEILEHVPHPYVAHREVFRVLRPGGRHVFTVPFGPTLARDIHRARVVDGQIVHDLPPEYHYDPVTRDTTALVFTVFANEMLWRLAEIGFEATVYRFHGVALGLLGDNAYVFSARRPTGQLESR